MFRKILIANRGEIACRIIRTARAMGIATVAVFSEADANASHVALADEAHPIGPSPARESYLRGEAIIAVAQRSGAEAIHPGYGFLSENADFAEACATAGLVFIGPPPSAIRAMGSKAAAKALMASSGVPLVPGYHGDAQDDDTLIAAAIAIGFPVLIKASAGGGGKGMRIVRAADELTAAIDGARREALASFADGRLLIERYLQCPRHIEMQVFADRHGNIVHLFERDCSIQRRHQKVLEEAPAPGLTPAQRDAMGQAAIAAARAIAYVGAGTIEFIAEGGAFYFMEMNTRLQVEHPVTEMITGTDLVAWQLRIAAGQPLPLTQAQLAIHGHAIEARLYAEDPARDYLPSIGTITHLRQPAGEGVRVDTGVRAGDAITPYYDPMIAKLIVWGETRAAALHRLAASLAAYEVTGVRTNLALLRAVAGHEAFARAALDTGFLTTHADTLAEPKVTPEERRLALAAACLALLPEPAGDDPWACPDGFQLNLQGHVDLHLAEADTPHVIRATPEGVGFRLVLPDGPALVQRDAAGLRLDGARHAVTVVRDGATLIVVIGGRNHTLRLIDPLAPPPREAEDDGSLAAPIPARIARILVAAGDHVAKGAALLVLEAMKMEITLTAPRDGVIAELLAAPGEMVREGAILVRFEAG